MEDIREDYQIIKKVDVVSKDIEFDRLMDNTVIFTVHNDKRRGIIYHYHRIQGEFNYIYNGEISFLLDGNTIVEYDVLEMSEIIRKVIRQAGYKIKIKRGKYIYTVETLATAQERHSFYGAFTNKKVAIEYCDRILYEYNGWVDSMIVPIDIYMQHIKDFKKDENGYVWNDYLGYTPTDWEKSHEVYQDNETKGMIVGNVRKYRIGHNEKDTLRMDIVHSKTEASVTGKEPPNVAEVILNLRLCEKCVKNFEGFAD